MSLKSKRFSKKMRKSGSLRGGGPKFKQVKYNPHAHVAKSRKSRFRVVQYDPNAHLAGKHKSNRNMFSAYGVNYEDEGIYNYYEKKSPLDVRDGRRSNSSK